MSKSNDKKSYSIFGAGAAGLYTAWRLLNGKAKQKNKALNTGDILRLYDWGKYDFSEKDSGTREPGARVCTWHYKDNHDHSYLELGGMRYSYWDGSSKGEGHRLVTTTIERLGLDKYSVPFNESSDPLMSLRSRNMYMSQINSNNPAPYAADHYGANVPPDNGFGTIEQVAGITADNGPKTRREWCHFFEEGKITARMSDNSIFQKGDRLKDIGYWNLGYDILGQEGYAYLSDGNGYSSNVVNSHSAQSFSVNDEFTPGTEYKTLTKGFSSLFDALFNEVQKLAKEKGVTLEYHPNTRLRSILHKNNTIHYTTATRKKPDTKQDSKHCNAAFLAMPRSAIELVAQATRYSDEDGCDVLNHERVQLYLESVFMEPSYKVGMFFDSPWWEEATYAPKLTSYFLTTEGINQLAAEGFPKPYLEAIQAAIKSDSTTSKFINQTYTSEAVFIQEIERCLEECLTVKQQNQLCSVALLDTIGPSVTDMPIRQVVYFGDNALNKNAKKVYGILASYDDIQYTGFWKALELGSKAEREIAESRDLQPLEGPRKATTVMVKMLRKQLAALHFGPQSQYSDVPEPLETRYMDWSLPPFNAGYHAYKSHYDMGDVQQKIRKPSQVIKDQDAEIYIVGETYSNDQAWVEGAFCTAESVLNDFFGIEPIISEEEYPFICPSYNK